MMFDCDPTEIVLGFVAEERREDTSNYSRFLDEGVVRRSNGDFLERGLTNLIQNTREYSELGELVPTRLVNLHASGKFVAVETQTAEGFIRLAVYGVESCKISSIDYFVQGSEQ
jgi:hypothetical protein